MNMQYGVPGTRGLPQTYGRWGVLEARETVPATPTAPTEEEQTYLAALSRARWESGYTPGLHGAGFAGGFIQTATQYPTTFPPFTTGMGAQASGVPVGGLAAGYKGWGAAAPAVDPQALARAIQRPPPSIVEPALPPPCPPCLPCPPTTHVPLSGFGYAGPTAYAGPYGLRLRKDAATQCAKWQSELTQAQAGIGKGLFGIFGGKGLFGQRQKVLGRKIQKWCTKAETQATAAQQAADFAAALTPGGVSIDPGMDVYSAQPDVGEVAADNTMVFAGIGLAVAGVMGMLFLTRKT